MLLPPDAAVSTAERKLSRGLFELPDSTGIIPFFQLSFRASFGVVCSDSESKRFAAESYYAVFQCSFITHVTAQGEIPWSPDTFSASPRSWLLRLSVLSLQPGLLLCTAGEARENLGRQRDLSSPLEREKKSSVHTAIWGVYQPLPSAIDNSWFSRVSWNSSMVHEPRERSDFQVPDNTATVLPKHGETLQLTDG